MSVQRMATLVMGLAVLLIIGAIFWSLSTYGTVGQSFLSKGLRPPAAIHCLYGWSEKCVMMREAAAAKGTIAYTPVMFWTGMVLIVVSLVWNGLHGGRDGSGNSRAQIMQRLLIPVDRISTFVGQFFAWTIVLLTLAVSYEVFSRYIFGRPTTWAFDASYILYGTLFIMAGAYALCRNGHVRGDFLYRSWRPRVQAGMDLLLYILFFFPAILAFIYSGYGYAAQAWMTHEHSPFSPAGPPIYHFKTLIPATGVLLLLQGIVEVIRCIACLRTGVWPHRLHDVEELEKVILEQHQHVEGKSA
jgi:TRAP-type mannitol/chloroaromatic compound transport system permease small subunit